MVKRSPHWSFPTLIALATIASAPAALAQSFNPHQPVSDQGEDQVWNRTAAAGLQPMRGYAGAGRPLRPGEVDDSRASIRNPTSGLAAAPMLRSRQVVGQDDLVRIDPTTNYPDRAVARINFFAPATQQNLKCTGFLVSKNLVATEGGCVHYRGEWARNVRVTPAQNGFSRPYGECRGVSLHSVRGWTNGRDPRFNYGAIKLDCDIGLTTGYFGLAVQSSLTNRRFYVNGYPDLAVRSRYDPGGTQWQGFGRVTGTSPRIIFHNADMVGGMRGGPLWNWIDGCSDVACAVGIVLSDLFHDYDKNSAVRIVDPIFLNYYNWAGGDSGPIQ